MNSRFVSPVIIIPKKDYINLVLHAWYLNPITVTSICSWPLEPLQVLMTRINGSNFTISDLSCTYHQVPLTDEAQKLTSFIVRGWQYTYQVSFYGLKPLPNLFSKLMRYAVGPLIKKSNHLHRRHSVTESKEKWNVWYNSRISFSVRESQLKSCPR